ncbi:MAG: cell division protein FtsZ [Aquabacterium sp.]|nr:cell division protein FtsZ [Aquabacterium sp.]
MTDSLQVALAVVGISGLVALVGWNTWQARRSRIKSAATLPPQEPRLAEPVFDAGDTVPQERDPADIAVGAVLQQAAPAARREAARLDPLIDALATVTPEAPVSGEQAQAHLPPTRRAGSKPFAIEGLATDTGQWEPVQPGRSYSEFQAGVQLANRLGALNEIEYSEFVHKVQAFADALGAAVDFPDMLDVVARARELDHFASEHDAQLAMHLRARGSAWSIGYVQQHAARHGFVPGAMPGRLVLPSPDEGAPPILTLQFDAQAAFAEDPSQVAVRELTLAFDVPQTAPEQEPFLAWRAAGEALAPTLDADLTDDRGQPLPPAAFESIGRELARLYEALGQRDLAAGSPLARRVFS